MVCSYRYAVIVPHPVAHAHALTVPPPPPKLAAERIACTEGSPAAKVRDEQADAHPEERNYGRKVVVIRKWHSLGRFGSDAPPDLDRA